MHVLGFIASHINLITNVEQDMANMEGILQI
jgi:hypothetical protein